MLRDYFLSAYLFPFGQADRIKDKDIFMVRLTVTVFVPIFEGKNGPKFSQIAIVCLSYIDSEIFSQFKLTHKA